MSGTYAIVGDCPACALLAFLIIAGPSKARVTLARTAPGVDAINVRSVSRGEAIAMDFCTCKPDITDELAVRCPWCGSDRGKSCREYRKRDRRLVDVGDRVWSHPSRIRLWERMEATT